MALDHGLTGRRVSRMAAACAVSFMLAGPCGAAEGTPADVPVPATGGAIDAETKCLALAVYWEGRAEPARGRQAIAHTVLNRVRSPDFPNSVCGVVGQGPVGSATRGCQFSWWCDGRRDSPREADKWQEAIVVARAARGGQSKDPTGGALYFHAGSARPDWSRSKRRLAEIGDHVFYR